MSCVDPIAVQSVPPWPCGFQAWVRQIGRPQAASSYAYALANPTELSDPSGLFIDFGGMSLSAEGARGLEAILLFMNGDTSGAVDLCESGCGDYASSAIAHAVVMGSYELFDDGKHNDGGLDQNIWKGDFEAVRDNKHGNASRAERWAAGVLLENGDYSAYETKPPGSWWVPDGLSVSVFGGLILGGYLGLTCDWDANCQVEVGIGVGLGAQGGIGPTWGEPAPDGVVSEGLMVAGGVSAVSGGYLHDLGPHPASEVQDGTSSSASVSPGFLSAGLRGGAAFYFGPIAVWS